MVVQLALIDLYHLWAGGQHTYDQIKFKDQITRCPMIEPQYGNKHLTATVLNDEMIKYKSFHV